MCGEEDITFVDNSKFLHLADGSINDGYYLKVHLNSKATDKLVHNLQLKLKDNVHSACVPQNRPQTRGTQNDSKPRPRAQERGHP